MDRRESIHQYAQAIWKNGIGLLPRDRLDLWLRPRFRAIGSFVKTYDQTDHKLHTSVEAVIVRRVWDRLIEEGEGPYGLFIDSTRLLAPDQNLSDRYSVAATFVEGREISRFAPIDNFDGERPLMFLDVAFFDTWQRAIIREVGYLENLSQSKGVRQDENEVRLVQTYEHYKKTLEWLWRHRETPKEDSDLQSHLLRGVGTGSEIMTHFFYNARRMLPGKLRQKDVDFLMLIIGNSYPSVVEIARHRLLFTSFTSWKEVCGLPRLKLDQSKKDRPRLIVPNQLRNYSNLSNSVREEGDGCPAGALFDNGYESVIHQMWEKLLPIVEEIFRRESS